MDDDNTIGGSVPGQIAKTVVGAIRESCRARAFDSNEAAELVCAQALLIGGMELLAEHLGIGGARRFVVELLDQGLPTPAGDETLRH